jgi:hypothetical protein
MLEKETLLTMKQAAARLGGISLASLSRIKHQVGYYQPSPGRVVFSLEKHIEPYLLRVEHKPLTESRAGSCASV